MTPTPSAAPGYVDPCEHAADRSGLTYLTETCDVTRKPGEKTYAWHDRVNKNMRTAFARGWLSAKRHTEAKTSGDEPCGEYLDNPVAGTGPRGGRHNSLTNEQILAMDPRAQEMLLGAVFFEHPADVDPRDHENTVADLRREADERAARSSGDPLGLDEAKAALELVKATVRRETIEECAKAVEYHVGDGLSTPALARVVRNLAGQFTRVDQEKKP